MKSRTRLIIASLLLFVVSSCGGKSNYLYYTPPGQQGSKIDHSYKVKDVLAPSQLDMLWIIDNSGSMSAYQQSVANNTSAFIDVLTKGTGLSWKIGLISTSVSDKPYLGFDPGDELISSDTKAADRFKAAVAKLGTYGDSTEKTFDPVLNVLKAYPGFLRSEAELAMILVSDAPEQSERTSTDDFLKGLEKLKGSLSKVFFYGVLDPSDWCPSTDDIFSWSGNKFDQLLQKIGGAAYKICDPQFSNNLIDIAQKMVDHATFPKIFLAVRPKPETIQVLFHGEPLPGGPKDKGGLWIYNFRDNAIVFYSLGFAQGDTEEVRVTYQEDVDSP